MAAFPTHAQKAILDYLNTEGSDGKNGQIWIADSGFRGVQECYIQFEENSRKFHMRVFNGLKSMGYLKPINLDGTDDLTTPLDQATLFAISAEGIRGIDAYRQYHAAYHSQRAKDAAALHRKIKNL